MEQEATGISEKRPHADHPLANNAPLFLVGALRSGTTMLRLMLDGHASIRIPFEFDFAVDAISDGGRYPEVSAYLDYLSSHRIFQATGLLSNAQLSYHELVRSYLTQVRDRDRKPIVGGTLHRHFEHLPGLWPNARYLHLLRDGRDVARSAVRMGWAGNAYMAADVWLLAEEAWDRLRHQVPSEQLHEVRYEQLVHDPEGVLRGVCEFLGLPYDPNMLRYAERSSYRPPNIAEAAGWNDDGDAREEAQLAEAKIGPMLSARGYPLSSAAQQELSAAERTRLQLDSRIKALRFRAQRYGTGLLAIDVATRRLPFVPRTIRHAVQRKLNQIEQGHLK